MQDEGGLGSEATQEELRHESDSQHTVEDDESGEE
jgi:hypothetical protein